MPVGPAAHQVVAVGRRGMALGEVVAGCRGVVVGEVEEATRRFRRYQAHLVAGCPPEGQVSRRCPQVGWSWSPPQLLQPKVPATCDIPPADTPDAAR